MRFINLVINEFIKIFKKKSTIFLITLAVLSLLCCAVIYLNKNYDSNLDTNLYDYVGNKYDAKMNIRNYEIKLASASTKREKTMLNEKLKIYKFLLEKGNEAVFDCYYKYNLFDTLIEEVEKLGYIDSSIYETQYIEQQDKVNKLLELLKEGTFEEYIKFNKEDIEKSYLSKEISIDEYNLKLNEQENNLRYEIGKFTKEDTIWKEDLLKHIEGMKAQIRDRFDHINNVYLDDKDIKKLEDNILIEKYRLENNKPPYFTIEQRVYNDISFLRYNYNLSASNISMFFVGLLTVILASSCISEEISEGTIKFSLIIPCKRYKILLCKLVAILIIALICIVIISQLSVLIGNLFFGANTNEYIFVNDNNIEIMSTHLYETLYYLLNIPKVIVYIFIALACSVVFQNIVSNIVSITTYIAVPFGINVLNNISDIEFIRYLPFSNFDFINKIIPTDICKDTIASISTTSLKFSIVVLIITIVLLVITSFDGFNKKEI